MSNKVIVETVDGIKEVERKKAPLSCIVCDEQLWNQTLDEDKNWPDDACTFTTTGQYGSTVFDSLSGEKLEVNICDQCLREALARGVIGYWPALPKRKMKLWEGEG